MREMRLNKIDCRVWSFTRLRIAIEYTNDLCIQVLHGPYIP